MRVTFLNVIFITNLQSIISYPLYKTSIFSDAFICQVIDEQVFLFEYALKLLNTNVHLHKCAVYNFYKHTVYENAANVIALHFQWQCTKCLWIQTTARKNLMHRCHDHILR